MCQYLLLEMGLLFVIFNSHIRRIDFIFPSRRIVPAPNAALNGGDDLKEQQYLQSIKIIFVTLYTIRTILVLFYFLYSS